MKRAKACGMPLPRGSFLVDKEMLDFSGQFPVSSPASGLSIITAVLWVQVQRHQSLGWWQQGADGANSGGF